MNKTVENGTLFFVDDHSMMLNGLKNWVEKNTFWKTIGSANNIGQAKTFLTNCLPDHLPEICIIDVQLGEESGFDLLEYITAAFPPVKCVMFSMFDSSGYISQAKILGAKGYVSKASTEATLSKCLEIVRDGGLFIEEKMLSKQQKIDEISHFMTKRERQVFEEILKEHTNEQIAESLNMSVHSVECYVSRIYDITNCRTRMKLIQEYNN